MAHVMRDTHTGEVHAVEDTGDKVEQAVDKTTNVAARIISLIGGIIVGLLGLRFILMLLGANPTNGLVDFVYSVTYPLAAPFFGIFNYQEQLGAARLEFETLIAMAVYALITWALVRIVTIGNRHVEV